MVAINWDTSEELDKLAELSIKTGVALQPGQDLLITAPLEAADLVRRITFLGYKVVFLLRSKISFENRRNTEIKKRINFN